MQRTIHSFVRRRGRITTAQKTALEKFWSIYGIDTDFETVLDLDNILGRKAARMLEIGFGKGETLINMAKIHPENDYLGIDVHLPGIGSLLNAIKTEELTNVRILCADVVEVLKCLPLNHFDAIYIFFPDPWHKKRHKKRRLIQAQFINLLVKYMKKNGLLYLATDWENYAQQMLQVLDNIDELANYMKPGNYAPRFVQRPITRFENRGLQKGHQVWDLLYVRN
ncbi:MAG: tRNA (guanosine(46)-N7)-methyltransferase TrmB [Thiomargarita sp.]|nr:tRNA (guanosine(46)-N7)-methyltransferase TrmB [Thiomargarita sp.]